MISPALEGLVAASGVPPAVHAGDLLFLTGATGGDANGIMPKREETQTPNPLDKALCVIDAAGRTAQSIGATAVEVARLRRAGAVVECRILAHLPET